MNALVLTSLLAQLVSAHGSSAPVTGAPSSAGGIAWTVPKGWIAEAPKSMRVATHRILPAEGDPEGGELAIFYFGPGQGGSVDSNVDRWYAQFAPEAGTPKPPAPSRSKTGGLDVTLVRTEGTYASGMPGGATTPKKGWALRGAIAEGPGGAVFFKLVGPKKTVLKAGGDFDALVKSLRKSP